MAMLEKVSCHKMGWTLRLQKPRTFPVSVHTPTLPVLVNKMGAPYCTSAVPALLPAVMLPTVGCNCEPRSPV